jgi:hypothetical protein
MQEFHKFILGMKLYILWPVTMSIIRSFSLYTQQRYMSYRFADSLWSASGHSMLILLTTYQQTCMTYTIAVCTLKAPDDGQMNCPQHVEFHLKKWNISASCWFYCKKFSMNHIQMNVRTDYC